MNGECAEADRHLIKLSKVLFSGGTLPADDNVEGPELSDTLQFVVSPGKLNRQLCEASYLSFLVNDLSTNQNP